MLPVFETTPPARWDRRTARYGLHTLLGGVRSLGCVCPWCSRPIRVSSTLMRR